MASLLNTIRSRFYYPDGRPLSGGRVYTYEAGTLVPKASFSDAQLTIQNTNPVILDSAGGADVFISGSYKVRTFDAKGVLIESIDNISDYPAGVDANNVRIVAPFTGAQQRTQRDKNAESVSVKDFGAKGDGITDDSDAFLAAVAAMNARYTGLDGFLRNPPHKGVLHVPQSSGAYIIKQPLISTGNYSVIIDGVIEYDGVAGTLAEPITVWKIGRLVDFDFIADLDYKIGLYTTLPVATSYVNAFTLINMVDCRIYTNKIKGFNIALTCLASGSSNGGFYGNTIFIGTMDSNAIDIDLRSENFGSPNANRFFGGFFYKKNNVTYAQNCFRFSSDGGYVGTDSNLIDGCNFESGKGSGEGIVDGIPINLEVGIFNKFTNIRAENASFTALATIKDRDNIIETRSVFSTSTEVISPNIQQTVVIPQSEMIKVFGSGDLARESTKLQTSGRIYNPNVTFNDSSVLNQNSTLSSAALPLFDLTTGGIKLAAARAMLSFKVKKNGDRRFLLRTFAEDKTKKLNIVVVCYDAAGVRLANDPAIATGTWGVQQYVKSNLNAPLAYSADVPWAATGGYITPISNFQTRQYFEVHPTVATIEIYYRHAASGTDDDITLAHFELYSVEGSASPVDACAPTPTTGDRRLYRPQRGVLTLNLAGSATYDPPSLAVNTSATTTVTVVGAAVGDIVSAAFSADLQGIALNTWVSAVNTVSVRFQNSTASAVDLASGTINVNLQRLVF